MSALYSVEVEASLCQTHDDRFRFMEEWLKAADSIIEKLRLKSSTIKSQIKKANHQLRQREELGEALHAIDFQQLAIENQDYVKTIEEKNRYLLDLKRITGYPQRFFLLFYKYSV